MKKRILALLLAALMLGAAACSTDDPEESKKPGPSDSQVQPDETDPGATRPDSGLEMRTFDGATYRISSYNGDDIPIDGSHIYRDSYSGDKLEDAIYDRCSYVAETYDVTFDISSTFTDYSEQYKHISDLIKTNDDMYELIYGHCVFTCNNAVAGHFYDWYSLPYVEPTNPWWPQQSVEEMTIYGKMYTISTSITHEQLTCAKVLFLNKDLFDNYNKELPYDWVRKGTWTLDKLTAETQDVWTDENGDGLKDTEDIFGFCTHPVHNGFVVSCSSPVMTRTDDGGMEFSLLTERMSTLLEKLEYLYYKTQGTLVASPWGDGEKEYIKVFKNGHALYGYGQLINHTIFQEIDDFTYGIVPMPKFDEAQQEYYVFACSDLFSVPITCQNTEFAGYMFELLSYLGYYDVAPIYLSSTLKGQAADAPEDAEMLQLIHDNLTCSFAYCYDNWEGYGHLMGLMGFTQTEGKTNLSFVEAVYRTSATTRLEKVLNAFRGEFDS